MIIEMKHGDEKLCVIHKGEKITLSAMDKNKRDHLFEPNLDELKKLRSLINDAIDRIKTNDSLGPPPEPGVRYSNDDLNNIRITYDES